MKRVFRIALSIPCIAVFSPGCVFVHKCDRHHDPAEVESARRVAAAESAIRAADEAWAKAAETKGLEGFMSFYAPDARALPPNEPIAVGLDAIRKSVKPMFDASSRVTWRPTQVVAARSGEIGYAQGTYEITMKDPSAKPPIERGKYLEIWKKQPDNTWKCTEDMFSPDAPPAAGK